MADILGSLGNMAPNISGIGVKLVAGLQTIAIAGFFGVFFGLIFKFMTYNTKVVIYEQLGGNNVIERQTRGKFIKKKKTGERGFMLWKPKKFLPEPENDNMILSPKGKRIVYMTRMGEDDFRYMPVKNQFGEIIFEPSNVSDSLNWFLDQEEKAQRKHGKQSMLAQVLPYAVFILGVVGIIFMFMILMNKMDAAVPAIQGATNGMQKILSDWITVVREFTTVVDKFVAATNNLAAIQTQAIAGT